MTAGNDITNNVDSPDSPRNRRRKVPIRTKLLFSSGAFQEAAVGAGALVTVLFYNQILGVSPSLCGTAFLIASLVDAISDPLIGVISDHFKSRWGRRHPLMLASALPITITFYCLYQPIDGLSEIGYFIWLTVFLVLMRFSTTLYNIPHDALGAELTDDYEERSSVFGYNAVAVSLTAILMAGVVHYIIFPSTPEYANGFLDASRYYILAGMGAILIAVSVVVCSVGTMDQIPYLHDTTKKERLDYRKFFLELSILLRNRSYVAVCLCMLTIYAGLGIYGVVGTYAYVYVYSLSTEEMFIGGLAKIPGVLTALPLLIFLSKRMEKKQIFMLTTATMCILISLPHILKILDWFPGNESPFLLVALFLPVLLGFMIYPVSGIVIDSQLVDIADEHEYRTGSRAEGIIFSIRSFAIKTTSGLGGFIAGFGLELIGFPQDAEVGSLPPETVTGLLAIIGPVYLLFYLLGIGLMAFYNIDKNRLERILKELERRRKAVPTV